jgi:DNA-binding winged helix-turn-helix (wHTH) protein
LAYLIQHPGHTLTKEALWAQVWPQLPILSDQSLKKCVEQARKALGDAGQTPRYIQTVRGRGYRFIAVVEVCQRAETDARHPPPDMQSRAEEHGRDQANAELPPAPASPASPFIPPPAPPAALRPEAATSNARYIVPPEAPEDEWRQLTVLVCHLVGVSGRTAPLDREARLEVVRDFQAMCTEVVQRFDGLVAQYQVERLIVYFGYPRAHEDDVRRAVHTGLEMVEGMTELNRRRKQDHIQNGGPPLLPSFKTLPHLIRC